MERSTLPQRVGHIGVALGIFILPPLIRLIMIGTMELLTYLCTFLLIHLRHWQLGNLREVPSRSISLLNSLHEQDTL